MRAKGNGLAEGSGRIQDASATVLRWASGKTTSGSSSLPSGDSGSSATGASSGAERAGGAGSAVGAGAPSPGPKGNTGPAGAAPKPSVVVVVAAAIGSSSATPVFAPKGNTNPGSPPDRATVSFTVAGAAFTRGVGDEPLGERSRREVNTFDDTTTRAPGAAARAGESMATWPRQTRLAVARSVSMSSVSHRSSIIG